jgi:hypothetical protein
MCMVPPVKKKYTASTLIFQEAPRHRKGESSAFVGGPKEMKHILMGGIDYSNTFKGMQKYKETREKVVS